MATKPTDRILDWASGGTTTDPGGAKEAAGWTVSERPPAYWWNWILNSFGQWLTWSETSIDANEVDIADLQALPVVHAFGVVSGTTPTIDYNGANLDSVSISGGDLIVNLSVTFSSTATMVPFVTTHGSTGAYNSRVEIIDTNTVEIHTTQLNTAHDEIDLGVTAMSHSIMVMGTLA
jgi:hypothetical protein